MLLGNCKNTIHRFTSIFLETKLYCLKRNQRITVKNRIWSHIGTVIGQVMVNQESVELVLLCSCLESQFIGDVRLRMDSHYQEVKQNMRLCQKQ
jgi:hypothetical protein